jgi:hypothetical protein
VIGCNQRSMRGLTNEQINIPANTSYVTEHDDKLYVVLATVNRILAVYRVRPVDGMLRAMRRWPKAIGTVWEREPVDIGAGERIKAVNAPRPVT